MARVVRRCGSPLSSNPFAGLPRSECPLDLAHELWHILMYTASMEVPRCSDEPRCS
jgi:hypothetical protein